MQYSKIAIIACLLLALYAVSLNLHIAQIEESASIQIESLTESLSEKASSLALARMEITTLESLNSQLQKSIAEQTALKESALADLNSTRKELSLVYAQLQEEKGKVSNVKDELLDLEKKINSSMSWFRENSFLNSSHSWSVDIFLQRVESDCIYDGALNLACINYLTERTILYIEYLDDSDLGVLDRLQSINETIMRRGGDCEDIALFSKALLQTLKSNNNLLLKSWEPASDGRFIIWPQQETEDSYIYYQDARPKIIANLKDVYPYVICYTVDSFSGHCRIALSENKITSSSVDGLLGAGVFEPQTGMYFGRVGQEYSLCSAERENCQNIPNTITLAITENDIIKFSGSSWVSYQDYFSKTKGMMQDLG